MPINISKCSCMRIGPKCNEISRFVDLVLLKSKRRTCNGIKYLGVTIKFCRAKDFKCNWDEAKRKFYCNANVILGRLGTNVSPAVLLRLLYSQGV